MRGLEATGSARSVFVNIQYLRGLAAILVVYFHTKIYLGQFPWTLDRSFGDGGVDIFFVISGFIMTITNIDGLRGPIKFLSGRMQRIYPPYWIALTLDMILFAIFPSNFRKESLDTKYVIASYTLMPFENASNKSHGVPFLNIGWTLVFEMFFYMIFTFSLLLRNRYQRFLFQAAFIVGAVAYGAIYHPTSAPLGFATNPITVEFLYGCAVALYVGATPATPRFPRAGLVALLIGVFLPLFLVGAGHGDGIVRILYLGLPAAGIVWCAAVYEARHGAFFQSRLLKRIGDASYSIYLFHPFVLTGVRVAGSRVGSPSPGVSAIVVVLSVLLCITVGIGAHVWVEIPAIAAAKRFKSFLRSSGPATSRIG